MTTMNNLFYMRECVSVCNILLCCKQELHRDPELLKAALTSISVRQRLVIQLSQIKLHKSIDCEVDSTPFSTICIALLLF